MVVFLAHQKTLECCVGLVGPPKWHPTQLINSSRGNCQIFSESANLGNLQGQTPNSSLQLPPPP